MFWCAAELGSPEDFSATEVFCIVLFLSVFYLEVCFCSAKITNVEHSEAGSDELLGHPGGGSGGYLEYVLRHSAFSLFGVTVDDLQYKTLRWDNLIRTVSCLLRIRLQV